MPAGCVFVASIHPSRTGTSGSFESVRWNACVHRLDLGLHSLLLEFWGNGVRTCVNSKGKIPSTGKILLRGGPNPQLCIKQDSEPNTLPTSYSSPTLNMQSVWLPQHSYVLVLWSKGGNYNNDYVVMDGLSICSSSSAKTDSSTASVPSPLQWWGLFRAVFGVNDGLEIIEV